jgi:hypothetical protein
MHLRRRRREPSCINLHPFANDVSMQFIWAIKQNQTLQKHAHAHQISGYRKLPCLLHILQYLLGGLAKVVLFVGGVALASTADNNFCIFESKFPPKSGQL